MAQPDVNTEVFKAAEDALKEVDNLKARQAELLSQTSNGDTTTKSAGIIPADLSNVPTKYWVGGGIAAAVALAVLLK